MEAVKENDQKATSQLYAKAEELSKQMIVALGRVETKIERLIRNGIKTH